MAKYKNINEVTVDSFIDRVFAKAAKRGHSKAIEKLKKKDPKFAKSWAWLVKARDTLEKDLKAKGKDIDKIGADILRNL